MERALKHKYTVVETVYFTASNVARPAASGTYEVIRLLPTDGRLPVSHQKLDRSFRTGRQGKPARDFLKELCASSRLTRFQLVRRQKAPFTQPFC